ncbi:MAG TPA: fructose-6-phosphate aldolase [Clostridia bacterium]|nr:fructose-6-phosphate aldolase [Clostridia bacterium]
MKIFLDTANVDEIRRANSWGVLSGVTTNPSLVLKEKRSYEEVIKEIASIVDGSISAEVISSQYDEMIKEAHRLASLSDKIAVKIPMSEEGLRATHALSRDGIKVNVTLIFSFNQALLAALAGATYVSPFVGRLDDIGNPGMDVVRTSAEVFRSYGFRTEIIAASIRHPVHVMEAAMAGAHIATVPFKVLEQMLHHPLTDIGIKRFEEDSRHIPKS